MHIIAIVFDEPSRTLFWVDNLKEVIMKMHVPVEGEPGEPVVLHDLVGGSPHGIVLDVCNRYVRAHTVHLQYPTSPGWPLCHHLIIRNEDTINDRQLIIIDFKREM